MPLQKQALKVLFGGLEQDVTPKLVMPGATLELENMVWNQQGSAIKRTGSVALSETTVPAGGTPPRAWALGTHQGNLVRLGRQGQAPIMVRDPDHGDWIAPSAGATTTSNANQSWLKGPIGTTIQHAALQTTSGNTFVYQEVAVGSNYQCLVFVENSTTSAIIHERLIDLATGRIVVDRQVSGPAGRVFYPKVMIIGSRACFVYNNNGIVTTDVFDLSLADPSTPAGTITQAAEIVASTPICLAPSSDGTKLLAGYRGAAGQFRYATLDPAAISVVSVVNVKTNASAAITAEHGFVMVQNLDAVSWAIGYPALVTRSGTGGIVEHVGFITIDASNIRAGRDSTIDGADNTQAPIAACTNGGNGNLTQPIEVLYQGTGPSGAPSVFHASVTGGGTPTLDTNVINAFLASQIFRDAGGANLFVTWVNNINQETYFVMPVRANPTSFPMQAAYPAPVARFEVGNAGTLGVSDGQLPLPAVVSQATTYTAVRVVSANIDIVKIQLRNGIETQLPAPIFGTPVEAIESMFVPGGLLAAWDGRYYGLAGFSYFPSTPNVADFPGLGGLVAGGLYSYAAVFTYVDNQGRKWRSSPSVPVQHQLGGAFTQATVVTNYLQLVDRPGVSLEIYRDTQTQPGVLRLLKTVPNLFDDPANTQLSFVDSASDASIAANELLYTTGSIMANQTTPGFTVLFVFDNRLWGVSNDDQQALWYSDAMTPPGAVTGALFGAGLKFNQQLILDVRDDRGPITGAGVVDGRACVFKHDAVYTIDGTGPDGTGAGATYQVTRIASSVGSDNPRSIVAAFDGLWFKSSSQRAGIWRLDRGTALSYVGRGVRSYNSLTLAGAISLPEQSQIRFASTTGRWLVYDVVTQQWSTFTSPTNATSAACAVAWSGSAVWSSEDSTQLGIIMVEAANVYADGATKFGQRAVGPWLAFGDVLGFQRLYEFQGIGQTIDDHLLTVNLYRDNLDTDEYFVGIAYNMLLGAQPRWDWQCKPKQKLSSMKVELIGGQKQGGAATAGFALTGIALVVGVKVGLRKINPNFSILSST